MPSLAENRRFGSLGCIQLVDTKPITSHHFEPLWQRIEQADLEITHSRPHDNSFSVIAAFGELSEDEWSALTKWTREKYLDDEGMKVEAWKQLDDQELFDVGARQELDTGSLGTIRLYDDKPIPKEVLQDLVVRVEGAGLKVVSSRSYVREGPEGPDNSQYVVAAVVSFDNLMHRDWGILTKWVRDELWIERGMTGYSIGGEPSDEKIVSIETLAKGDGESKS